MTKPKYNRIIWCELTPNKYWSFGLETPNGAFFTRTYIGYSKAEATKRARREILKDDTIVNKHPPRRRRSR